MKKNERSDALRILIGVLQDNIQLSHLMTPAADLSPFSKELCFGVTRHYVRLAAIADRLIKKRPKGKDTDVWVCLLMGLYQLHALRTPDYAVVQETVALLNQLKKPWAKGLVNAVLRTYCREKETLLLGLAADPAYQYGHPSWLIQRIQKAWPNHWESIVTANNEHPPMTLRVNHQKISTEDYLSLNSEMQTRMQTLIPLFHQHCP